MHRRLTLKRILLVIFSVGWLLPLWLGVDVFLQFLQIEALPRWRGEQPINSFPFLSFVSNMFTTACIWLAATISIWSWLLSRTALPSRGSVRFDATLSE